MGDGSTNPSPVPPGFDAMQPGPDTESFGVIIELRPSTGATKTLATEIIAVPGHIEKLVRAYEVLYARCFGNIESDDYFFVNCNGGRVNNINYSKSFNQLVREEVQLADFTQNMARKAMSTRLKTGSDLLCSAIESTALAHSEKVANKHYQLTKATASVSAVNMNIQASGANLSAAAESFTGREETEEEVAEREKREEAAKHRQKQEAQQFLRGIKKAKRHSRARGDQNRLLPDENDLLYSLVTGIMIMTEMGLAG